MSAILESALGAERRAECIRQDAALVKAMYQGPAKFTPEEMEMGNVGIRWVTETSVGGRPTLHDVLDYIERRGEAVSCTCQRCRAFVFPTPKSL